MKNYAVALAAKRGFQIRYSVLVLPGCASIDDARQKARAIAAESWPDFTILEPAIASISASGEPTEFYPGSEMWVSPITGDPIEADSF